MKLKMNSLAMARKMKMNDGMGGEWPFNNLSPAQAERLAVLLEECGEVQQAIGKVLRHGYHSHNPVTGLHNNEALEAELGDLLFALELLTESGDLDPPRITAARLNKSTRIYQYLHHQE